MKNLCLAAWLVFALPISAMASTAAVPKELSLEKCLQIAIDHNPQLQVASTQFLAAEGRVISLHAILYPKLQVQGLSTPATLYVQVQQTLYNRAIFPQLRISRLTREQARVNYRMALDDVFYQVRQVYINALAARAQIDMFSDFSERETKALASTKQLFQAGQVQKNVVYGIQVKSNFARQFHDSAQLQYTQAVIALGTLLGQELPDSTKLTGDMVDNAPAKLDAGAMTVEALQNRNDLKLLEVTQLSAEQQIEVDLQNAWPLVGLSSNSAYQPPAFGPIDAGGYDLERNYSEPATQRQTGDSQLPLSFYVTWQVFDGGNLIGVKRSDKAQIATREVALKELRQSIASEVNTAVATITLERNNLRELSSEPSVDDLRKLSDLEYEAGRIRQLDRVYLEDDILQQEGLRIGARYRLSLAAAALDHALGHRLETTVAGSSP